VADNTIYVIGGGGGLGSVPPITQANYTSGIRSNINYQHY